MKEAVTFVGLVFSGVVWLVIAMRYLLVGPWDRAPEAAMIGVLCLLLAPLLVKPVS